MIGIPDLYSRSVDFESSGVGPQKLCLNNVVFLSSGKFETDLVHWFSALAMYQNCLERLLKTQNVG